MKLPPIALFAYKRAAHLKLCLEAIERSMAYYGHALPITIFCDAPRHFEDEEGVKKTRQIAKGWTGAHVIFREKNYGFRNITEGISEILQQHESVIVIEDDVIVSPDFIAFMVAALERYKNEPQVFMISGFMYFDEKPFKSETFFLPAAFIWGWATYRHAWRHFEWKPRGWQEFLKDKKERHRFDFYGGFPFSKSLEKTMRGQWNTWDIQWMYTLYRERGLALYPAKSLTWNCGVGGGVHGRLGQKAFDEDPTLALKEWFIHGPLELADFREPRLNSYAFPKAVSCDERAMRHLSTIFLKERLRTEKRKRWRLYLKFFLQSLQSRI